MGAVAFFHKPDEIKAAVLHNPFILPSLWYKWIAKHEEKIREKGYVELIQKETGEKIKYGLPLLEESLDSNDDVLLKERVNCPTLVIFGENDSTPTRDRKKTYELFSGKKEMRIVKGMGHDKATLLQCQEITRLSLDWFLKYL